MPTPILFYKWLCQQQYRLDPCGRFYHFVNSYVEDKKAIHKPPVKFSDIVSWIRFINDIHSTLDVSGDFLIAFCQYMLEYNLEDEGWHHATLSYLGHVDRLENITREILINDPSMVSFANIALEAVREQKEYLRTEMECYELMYKDAKLIRK